MGQEVKVVHQVWVPHLAPQILHVLQEMSFATGMLNLGFVSPAGSVPSIPRSFVRFVF